VGVPVMLLHPPPPQQDILGFCFPQTFEVEDEEELPIFVTQ